MNSKGLVQVYVKTKYRPRLAYLAMDLGKKESKIVREQFEKFMDKQMGCPEGSILNDDGVCVPIEKQEVET